MLAMIAEAYCLTVANDESSPMWKNRRPCKKLMNPGTSRPM
jgi:hypothetical protein